MNDGSLPLSHCLQSNARHSAHTMAMCDDSNNTAALFVETKQAGEPLSLAYMLAQSPGFGSHCERYMIFCFLEVFFVGAAAKHTDGWMQPASSHLCASLQLALHAAAFAFL